MQFLHQSFSYVFLNDIDICVINVNLLYVYVDKYKTNRLNVQFLSMVFLNTQLWFRIYNCYSLFLGYIFGNSIRVKIWEKIV